MNNMSKLSRYLKEREGVDSLETEFGFATFIITEQEVYIRDIFIDKEFRQQNKASELANAIAIFAKEKGCVFMTGSVHTKAKGADTSIKVLLGYGMSVYSANNDLIIFKKDI